MKKLILSAALLFLAYNTALRAEPASKVIATVVERGSGIYAYNDKGTIITTVNGGNGGPKDGLVGYTQSTISVRRGGCIYVYNPNGTIISTVNAK
jgi:hypothetical protein